MNPFPQYNVTPHQPKAYLRVKKLRHQSFIEFHLPVKFNILASKIYVLGGLYGKSSLRALCRRLNCLENLKFICLNNA